MQRRSSMVARAGTLLGVAAALALGACSGGNLKESVVPEVLTQQMMTAHATGSEACADCHDGPPAFYQKGYHRLAFFRGTEGVGCESCHGNGSVHIAFFEENDEYEDDVDDLVGIDALSRLTESQRSALCQQCHQADFPLWPTTDHARNEVGCWDCHNSDLHSPPTDVAAYTPAKVNAQRDSEFCYQCHEDIRPAFKLQYHHRVPEGQMKCEDCHTIHGEARNNPVLQERNVACLNCHPEMRGPFVYEHLGMEEGCESCHDPHGSINNKLLLSNDNSLCIQCHFQEPSGFFGRQPHSQFLQAGARCYDCHFQVHGSNTNRNFNPRRF